MNNTHPAYRQLSKLLGKWNTNGRILAANGNPEIKITGTDTYEWMPGNFFLLHKVDVSIGGDKNQTLEIIGHNEERDHYTMQYYDNKGNSGSMVATVTADVWMFIGESLRFTGSFYDEGNIFAGIWERSADGKNWEHFMDIQLSREK